ncbi:MAG: PilZ domain-containing protein [Deltaproteobacteria bacterium]|nr:PilZ domain-containing protein [Deltaproteobacteria bacterium]
MGKPPSRRTIASYVPPQAFAPGARAALERLGYRIVPAVTRGRFADDSWAPDVRLVDECHLSYLPEGKASEAIIVVCDACRRQFDDPRVVGVAPRPLEVGTLYPLLQKVLEKTPRRAARAPARIAARCSHADRRWTGQVLSLSETGCLFQSQSDMTPGLEFSLLFPLPLGRTLSLRARVVGRQGERAGMAFPSPSPPALEAIADYVQRRLASL